MKPFILLSLCVFLTSAHLRAEPIPDPFQPTVTRAESRLLSEAQSLAQTDTAAAIALLEDERPDEAGPAIDFALGNFYFQTENLEQAEASYRAAVEKMPHFRAALTNLGRVLLLDNRPEETIEVYQKLVTDGQADADTLLLLGHALMLEDAPVGAETAYRQALLVRPHHTETRTSLAKALLRQQRYTEGQALVSEILEKDPLKQDLWSLKVSALLAEERIPEAIRALELARRLDQATADMLATLGDLWLHEDHPQEALSAYRDAFAQDAPDTERMLRAAEGFLMVEDATGTEDMLKRAEQQISSEAPPSQQIHLLRLQAELALHQKNPAVAEDILKSLLELDPLNGSALLSRARLERDSDEIEKALLSAERAARVEGFEAKALLFQARIEVERGNYARAIPLLETAQAFDPRDSVGRYLEQVKRLAE